MKICFVYLLLFIFCSSEMFSQNTPDAIWIEKSIKINVNEEKISQLHYNKLKINRRRGESYSNISISFSDTDNISAFKVSIFDREGKLVRKLDKSEIRTRKYVKDASLVDNYSIIEFNASNNSHPYYIEYSFERKTEDFASIVNWQPVENLKIPIEKAQLTIQTPKGYKIRYKQSNIDTFFVQPNNDKLVYQWQASYKKILHPELYSPNIKKSIPIVNVVPEKFNCEISGSFTSWNSYGNWQYELNQRLSNLSSKHKKNILKIIAGTSNTKERIKKLYNFAQDHIKHIKLPPQTEFSKTYSANDVAKNKLAESKALTQYFKAILEVAGIKSYYTGINTDSPINGIDKTFPSSQFNHQILYVPTKTDTFWLDCSSKTAFGYVNTVIQNRDVFIVDKPKSTFSKTPVLTPQDVCRVRHIKLTNENDSITNAFFEFSLKGQDYEQFLAAPAKNEKRRIIESKIANLRFDLDSYELKRNNRDSAKVEFSCKASALHFYKPYGDDFLVQFIPIGIPDFEKPENRISPVQIDYPICKIDTVVYPIPKTHRVISQTLNQNIENEYGKYSIRFIPNGNELMVLKSLILYPNKILLNDYIAFIGFIDKIKKIDEKGALFLQLIPNK